MIHRLSVQRFISMMRVADRLIPEHRHSHRLPPTFLESRGETGMSELETLKSFLRYEPDTGLFFWIDKPSPRIRPGLKAGYVNNAGYISIGLQGKRYSGQRLAWAFCRNAFPSPSEYIDHINGIKTDNRICNLRILDNAGNQQNRWKPNANSATKCTGVHWRKKSKKYQSRIMVNGERICLGYYDSLEDAIKARKDAERQLYPYSPIAAGIAAQANNC